MNLSTVLAILLAAFTSTGLAQDAGSQLSKKAWLGKEYAKVIGYRFKAPGEDSDDPQASGFSLLTATGVDTRQLPKLTVKSAELTAPQIARLLKAIFSTEHHTGPSACYDPHNIYVFYAESGEVVKAIEVCFGCTGLFTAPDTGKPYWSRHDLIALAHLTNELGLWPPDGRSVAQFDALQKWREHSK
jgi:hypothetical protein